MTSIVQDPTGLCVQAEEFAKASNWEAGAEFFAGAAATWAGLDPEGGLAELRKRFAEAEAAFQARREADRTRRERLAEREALCAEIERHAAADGAVEFTGRLHEIQSAWKSLPALQPQYLEILQARFDRAVQAFSRHLELEREALALRNERLPELERCCARAEELAEGTEWILAEAELRDLRRRWQRRIAGVKGLDSWQERFDRALADFDRRKRELAATLAAEIRLLQELCGEMEACLRAADLKSVLPQVRQIKSRWHLSEIKDPAKEELQRRFRTMLNSYHRQINELFEEEEWSRWENYTIKLGLCGKAGKLVEEANFRRRLALLKELQGEWKQVGPVPREKADALWAVFHDHCEKAYQECRAFFDGQSAKRAASLQAKTALCEQAEALQSSEDWEPVADRLKAMQAEWRALGPAPKDKDDELFQRFRTACNAFFERRKAHYREVHRVQTEHKKARVALCEQAEALLAAADLRAAIPTAMGLRGQWKGAAPAARHDEHALWQRFNAALGKFFDKLDQDRNESLQRKQAICAEIERLAESPELSCDCDRLAEVVAGLRDEWRRLGPSPRDQGGEVEGRYRAALGRFDGQCAAARRERQAAFATSLAAKEEILGEVATTAPDDDRETAAANLERRWRDAGPIAPEQAAGLEARFAAALAALRSGDAAYFQDLARQEDENLKARRELCVRMERLAGIESPDDDARENVVSADLINELKMAIESNFGTSGGRREDRREAHVKATKIRREWHQAGPVPAAGREAIERRFAQADAAFTAKYGRN